MERKRRPKSLRGGKGTLEASKPVYQCRDHGISMVFDPVVMGWVCTEEGCNYRRYKKMEIDQYGPPLVCEGPYTLVLYGNERILMRGSNNVAVDITDIVTGIAQTTHGSAYSVHQIGYELSLEFSNAIQMDVQR